MIPVEPFFRMSNLSSGDRRFRHDTYQAFHKEIDDFGMTPIKHFMKRLTIWYDTYQTFHEEIDDFGMIPIKHFICRSTISV